MLDSFEGGRNMWCVWLLKIESYQNNELCPVKTTDKTIWWKEDYNLGNLGNSYGRYTIQAVWVLGVGGKKWNGGNDYKYIVISIKIINRNNQAKIVIDIKAENLTSLIRKHKLPSLRGWMMVKKITIKKSMQYAF